MQLTNQYKSNLHKQQVLPSFITRHLQHKIVFDTTVQQSCNGLESRFAKRKLPLKEYMIHDYRIKRENFQELDYFFNNKLGKLYSFLLWDLSNHYIEDAKLIKAPSELFAFLKDGESAYWLSQTYSKIGEEEVYRVIKTPVDKTIKITPESIKSNFRYDEERGIFITNVQQLPNDLKISCHFYTTVRFDNDSLEYQESLDYILLHNLKLKEVVL